MPDAWSRTMQPHSCLLTVKRHCTMTSGILPCPGARLSFSFHSNRYTCDLAPASLLVSHHSLLHLQAAPQLWKLEIVRDKSLPNPQSPFTGRMNLKHTFAVNVPTSIAGSCYFGGKEEQFVHCVGKGMDLFLSLAFPFHLGRRSG